MSYINVKDETFIEWQRKAMAKDFERDIKNIIGYSLGLHKGIAYKMKDSLQTLIDYKCSKESTRLKLYVSTIDTLVELIKAKIPFIDMTGIDLTWTPQRILDYINDIYYNHPIIPLKMD